MAQAVIGQCVTAESWVRFLTRKYQICFEQSGTGTQVILFSCSIIPPMVGREISVDIGIRYGLDGARIESQWKRDFAPAHTGPGAHPASYTMGTESFPGVKRPGRC
jgi:hypothetical protein